VARAIVATAQYVIRIRTVSRETRAKIKAESKLFACVLDMACAADLDARMPVSRLPFRL